MKVFSETNVLYLEISSGNDALHKLHESLNTGLLAHDENFNFLPHLTISGSIPTRDLVKPAHKLSTLGKNTKGRPALKSPKWWRYGNPSILRLTIGIACGPSG